MCPGKDATDLTWRFASSKQLIGPGSILSICNIISATVNGLSDINAPDILIARHAVVRVHEHHETLLLVTIVNGDVGFESTHLLLTLLAPVLNCLGLLYVADSQHPAKGFAKKNPAQ